MKRRYHLEWHRIRKDGSPGWRRRRDRLHSLKRVRITGPISPASTTLVDPLDGSFVGNPPFVSQTSRGTAPMEVVVVLLAHARHRLLEAGQLILEIFHRVGKYVQHGGLFTNHLPQVIGLENET